MTFDTLNNALTSLEMTPFCLFHFQMIGDLNFKKCTTAVISELTYPFQLTPPLFFEGPKRRRSVFQESSNNGQKVTTLIF